jgi:hypothetical protein
MIVIVDSDLEGVSECEQHSCGTQLQIIDTANYEKWNFPKREINTHTLH